MKEKLKIIKPKTRPIQIEPWFFRYLNEGQLKVVSAILSHADIKDRQSNSFPSNRTIAFYCGFGLISPGTKTHEKYKSLCKDEQKTFKVKRIKNALTTVKNIKKELEKIGLLKRDFSGKNGNTQVFYTLDLEWKKEQYLHEHEEYFNDEPIKTDNDENIKISQELEKIKTLHEEGNISKKKLADILRELSYVVKAKDYNENEFIPIEDVDKVADYYMQTQKVQNKVELGTISNEAAYRQGIINSIKNNEFSQADKIYKKIQDNELNNNIKILTEAQQEIEPIKRYASVLLNFEKIEFIDNVYLAKYTNDKKTSSKYFIINTKFIKTQLLSPHAYTRTNKKIIDNYENNSINLINKMQENVVKQE